jgi:hypothetical protein
MFIARAVNKWGPATLWSEPTTILAATVPEIVATITSQIDPTTGGILIQWQPPHHRGSPLTQYKLQIESKAGVFNLIGECTGLSLSCLLEMSQMWAAPLELEFDNFIKLQVSAFNDIGQGDWSITHADTTVRIVPTKMLPVTRGALTNEF